MRRIPVAGLQVAVYDSGSPGLMAAGSVPLLLVHSVNACASAFEMEPVMLRQSRHRRVVALDLPGFGASDRPERDYTPLQMSAAILAVISAIGAPQVDLLALSLGCEFATQAALAQPARVRSLTLVSPTGMEDRRVGERFAQGRTRCRPWVRRLLRQPSVGPGLYQLLTWRPVMQAFLARSWGTRERDPRLLTHGLRCASQPGARHAPLDFVAGALFTRGIIERYRALPLPVWVAQGSQGAFTDFGACPDSTGTAAGGGTWRLQRRIFDSGAMPHFEMPDDFDAALCRFMDGLPMPRPVPQGIPGSSPTATAPPAQPASLQLR